MIGRFETTVWKIALLLAPWLAFAIVDRVVHGPGVLAWSAAVVLCYLIIAKTSSVDWLVYRLGWWIRVPTIRIGLLANRRWRRMFGVDPQPMEGSSRALWFDASLTQSEQESLPRLVEAFEVIETLVPSRSARLARVGPQIVVAHIPMVGGYIAGVDVLMLNARLLLEAPGVIASVIVHECNHGWLDQRGFRHPLLRRRLERLASIDQLLFAHRLHSAGRYAEANRVVEYLRANRRQELGMIARWRQMQEYLTREANSASR